MRISEGTPQTVNKELISALSEEGYANLFKLTPQPIINIISEQYNMESGNVHNKQIIGSFNNSNMDKVNIQGQQKIEINGLSNDDFESLKKQILALKDETLKEQQLEFYEQFLQALKDNDSAKARKRWDWIRKAVGDVAAVMTIGQILGFI